MQFTRSCRYRARGRGVGGAGFGSSLFLRGTAEGGSNIVVDGIGFDSSGYKWQINGADVVDPASENLVLHSSDLDDASWSYLDAAPGPGSRTKDGTIKAPNGVDDVDLWIGRNNIFFQAVSIALGTDYTLSFLYYGNGMQPAVIQSPDGSKRSIVFKPEWQRYYITQNSGASSTISVRIDLRTATLGGVSVLPDEFFRFAVKDFQVELTPASGGPTSYIFTEGTTVSRPGGQLASGESFFIPTANDKDEISVVSLDTGAVVSKTFDKKRFAIFIGQSNSLLGGGTSPYRDIVSSYVKAIGRRADDSSGQVTDGLIEPYRNPSYWNASINGNIGTIGAMDPGDMSSFGIIADNISSYFGDVEVICECASVPGSSFVDTWNITTGVNYQTMKTRIDNLLSTYPDAELVGIFASHMETDIVSGFSLTTHQNVVIETINEIRNLYGSCPAIFYGVADDWAVTSELRYQYMELYRELNAEGWTGLRSAAFIDTDQSKNGGIFYSSNNQAGYIPGDRTHFSSDAHIILAQMIFTKWQSLKSLPTESFIRLEDGGFLLLENNGRIII